MELIPIKTNCTELRLNDYIVLFSYKTPVAYQNRVTGEYFRTSTKWSRTTSKHIDQWLRGIEATEVPQIKLDRLIRS